MWESGGDFVSNTTANLEVFYSNELLLTGFVDLFRANVYYVYVTELRNVFDGYVTCPLGRVTCVVHILIFVKICLWGYVFNLLVDHLLITFELGNQVGSFCY